MSAAELCKSVGGWMGEETSVREYKDGREYRGDKALMHVHLIAGYPIAPCLVPTPYFTSTHFIHTWQMVLTACLSALALP